MRTEATQGLPGPPLQSPATGLPAWGRGQTGQVGNEAALTVVTSAGVRLVTRTTEARSAAPTQEACLNASTA